MNSSQAERQFQLLKRIAFLLWVPLVLWPSARGIVWLQLRLLTGLAPRGVHYESPWYRPDG